MIVRRTNRFQHYRSLDDLSIVRSHRDPSAIRDAVKMKKSLSHIAYHPAYPPIIAPANNLAVDKDERDGKRESRKTDLCPSPPQLLKSRTSPVNAVQPRSRRGAEEVARSPEAFSVTGWLRASTYLVISLSGRAYSRTRLRVPVYVYLRARAPYTPISVYTCVRVYPSVCMRIYRGCCPTGCRSSYLSCP